MHRTALSTISLLPQQQQIQCISIHLGNKCEMSNTCVSARCMQRAKQYVVKLLDISVTKHNILCRQNLQRSSPSLGVRKAVVE
ncbi:unnamed protein product, partial [Ceratitis capitata]